LPFVWRQSWYPADRFGRLETILTAGSTIREALTFHGIKQIYRARTQVHTRLPTALERRHLNMDRTDVAVVLEQLTVDGEDEPVSVGRAVLCSSRVNLVIET
ncbi:MAG: UTRA domain-containing protein, partial [Pseudomonadota bacterium]